MYVRKGNIKFTVVQDNIEKTLKIESIQKPKDENFPPYGYQDSELVGADFKKFLDEDVIEIIDDYIEYDFNGSDLKDVCDKIIKFEILDAEKKKLEMNIHIERDISMPERQVFLVLLEKRLYLFDRVKAVLASKSEAQRHEAKTGLMPKESYFEVVDAVMDFLDENRSINGILYYIKIDNFDEIEKNNNLEKVTALIQEVAGAVKKGFRTRDVLGYLGDGQFSAALIRIDEAEATIPLKRLESKLRAAMIGAVTGISVNVITTYESIDLEMESRALLERCKKGKKIFEIKL